MRLATRCCLLYLTVVPQLVAQDATAEKSAALATRDAKATEEEERNLDYLPDPLSLVRGNIRDLEATGYFKITNVDFRTGEDGQEKVVWTVLTTKPITCRHIELILRRYRDVRFYAILDADVQAEILPTLLHYSQRIESGATNNKNFGQDDQFELWIDLTPTELGKLRGQDASRVVFRRWKY